MAEELVLLTRLFDLLTWLSPKTERFPRVYRQTVTLRLMNPHWIARKRCSRRKAGAGLDAFPPCRMPMPH